VQAGDGRHLGDAWAGEFHAGGGVTTPMGAPTGGWAGEFQAQSQAAAAARMGGWAEEFAGATATAAETATQAATGATRLLEGSAATSAIVDTLSADRNPKFQQSQFLKFVSKMSRGELEVEGNQVRRRGAVSPRRVHPCAHQPNPPLCGWLL